MLKQTIQYEDYNGNQDTATLYFNLTKTELADLLEIQPRLEAFVAITQEPSRDLTNAETIEFLNLLKLFIERSYGVRSEDGKRFEKSEELHRAFTQTAAYDAFIFSLFENPENAVNFMTEILPKDLREGVTSKNESAQVVALPQSQERPLESYTDEELLALPQETFDSLVGTDPAKMSKQQLMLAFRRKTQGA